MKEYWVKDYYQIEWWGDKKYIHCMGYFYDEGDDAGEGRTSRLVEYTGFYCPLIEFLEWDGDEYNLQQGCIKQYVTDLTPEEAVKCMHTYYDGKPPIEMPLSEINMETPCGCYVDA